MPVSLTLTAHDRERLYTHLFPEDGCEAVAILLCGRAAQAGRDRLLVQRVVPVPYADCSVCSPDRVTWSTERLVPLLREASAKGLNVIKIHGHRGFRSFSETDDTADRDLFPSIHGWVPGGIHGSAILMDDGALFGRVVDEHGRFTPFVHVNVVGDDLDFYYPDKGGAVASFATRIAQAFGKGTYERLKRLRVAVVGCSGTGSPLIEQLARNAVGEIVLVDPDRVERKNLNRILHSSVEAAKAGRSKVDLLADAVRAMGLGTHVETHVQNLFNPGVVRAIASCDLVFGCMDSIDGRHLLNKLATFYLLPYFDVGVKLEADGKGGVDQVCGTVHYLQPGGSSLLSRRVYTLEQLSAAGLYRTDPDAYRDQLERGYIRGVAEDRPAVIQLNMLVASLAMNELLARLHPYRLDPNGDFAVHRISLSHGIYEHHGDGAPCSSLQRHIGRGDVIPLLDWAELSERKAA